MRIASLDLVAFGPFSGVRLDLSTPAPGLHVVYGTNEAGKSTTLRALHGLLFGIPLRTSDAHRHAMKDLRVGGTLVRGAGEVIEVVRRKGRKDTLLDPHGRPLPEAVLEPFLAGVTGPLFESAFGLDHVSLRTGAEEMLAGGGDVGESLFGASVGGAGIHRLRVAISAEADELFTSRGRGRKVIVQQTVRLVEQRGVLDRASTGPEGYERQKRALEDARAQHEALRRRHHDLMAEQSRVHRTLAVLKPVARRTSLLEQLRELGPLPDLAPEARELRLAAEKERDDAAREDGRLSDAMAELDARLAELIVPEPLLELDEAVVKEVDAGLARHRAAVADLPKVRAKLQAADEDVDKALAAVRPGLRRDELAGMRPGAALVARVRGLAARHGRLAAEVEQARRDRASRQARRDVVEARLSRLAEPLSVDEAARAVQHAEVRSDIEARVAEAAVRVAAAERGLAVALAGLGPGMTVEVARGVQPPLHETIDRYERELLELATRSRRLGELSDELRERRAGAERRLDATRRAGEVVTEEDLRAGRQERDAALGELRRSRELGEPFTAALDRAEAGVRRTDAMADRLRLEADRVAALASLEAEREAATRRLSEVDAEAGEARAACGRTEAAWAAEWVGLPAAPKPPAEMRSWTTRLLDGRRLAEALDEALRDRAGWERRRIERDEQLAAAARGLGVEVTGDPRVDRSRVRQVVEAQTALAAERRAAADELSRLSEELEVAGRAVAEREAALRGWREAWHEAMVELGLAADTQPEEALGVLDALAELFGRIDAADNFRRRISGMERDSAELDRGVRALAKRYLDGEIPDDVGDAARQLVRRHEKAHADRDTRAALLERRGEAAAAQTAARRRRREATERLDSLCRAAGAADPTELEALERKTESARALDRQLREVEAELVEAGAGSSIAELLEEIRGTRADEVKVRYNEIESELPEVVDELQRAAQDVATCEQGVARLGGSDAAAAAIELQHRVTTLDASVRRYLELRLAAAVLDREVERFRRENQGPVLARAAEIFPRLTLGRYVDLRVGYGDDDRASLRCVLADGKDVGVEALSDGTRDQLYLALRLATLEHHASRAEPMPFVLDDALVHFDDDRSAEALGVLGEIAVHSQVLFFTHHARLVEIAERVVPPARLGVHRLPGAR